MRYNGTNRISVNSLFKLTCVSLCGATVAFICVHALFVQTAMSLTNLRVSLPK